LECLEFRRAAGGDPGHLSVEAQAHCDSCARCAGYMAELIALDRTILKALQVPLPATQTRGRETGASGPESAPRGRWYALAASIMGGVLIGTLLFTGGSRESLARDAVAHLEHEPQALVVTLDAEDPAKLSKVLNRGGISLRPEIGTVFYAQTCWFRGHRVPHLVVQTDRGPVTVMVLRNESVPAPVNFAEHGYSGTIVPSGRGSIAVIGDADADLEQISRRVADAVIWQQD
jgi:Protein of unknown function (DUF3379)